MPRTHDLILILRQEYKAAYDLLDILRIISNNKDKQKIILFWKDHIKEINRITTEFEQEIEEEEKK